MKTRIALRPVMAAVALLAMLLALSVSSCAQVQPTEVQAPVLEPTSEGQPQEPAPTEVEAPTVNRGGTLTLSVPAPVNTLDPHKVTSHESFPATFHLFSALTRIGRDFSAEPELAESWEHSEDAMTWTFHLNENATFHSGRPVTAEDVKFSLERVLDPVESPRGYTTIGPIEEVVAQDDHTIVIQLSKPYLDLPIDLGGIYPRIVNKDNLPDINTNPDGSGPFKFKSWDPGGNVVLVRNENYFIMGEDGLPLPYIDEFRIVPIKDPTSELSALQTGAIDVMLQLSFDLLETAEQDPSIVVDGVPSGYHVLHLNLLPTFSDYDYEASVYQDVRVRQAFAYLIDREAMLQIAVGGHGVVGNDQPVPPYHAYGNPNIPTRTKDIARAKALLAEAGIEPGTHFTLYTTAGRPGLKELAVAFQEMAKEAGIVIDVEVVDVSRYFADMEFKAPFYVDTWDNRQTINATLKQFYVTGGSNNASNLSDPELDELLLAAESETDSATRNELYWKAMERISDLAVSIIPYYKSYYIAYRNGLVGIFAHPMTYMWVDRVWRSE